METVCLFIQIGSKMSTRQEQINALLNTREFLFTLLNPKETPRVPGAVRKAASSCLKHYPFPCEIFVLDEVPSERETDTNKDQP